MAATAVPLRSRRGARRRARLRVGDERLVARVRAGDDDAFEAIYDRYYLSLLAFCRHMLGSRHEAEDALQHSFASAYSALRGGDGVEDLRPWLYTIARNRCLSALRAQREELCADELELRPKAFDGLAGEIQLRADVRDLVDDLQRLPEDQRAALVLFELGDQSHEQIAAVLGVRREKVKALVFQAREALLRARRARDEPCADVRERVATGDVPRRSVLRGHIDRCPNCAAFEQEVRSQRAAFAAIMPVAPTVGLKASILAAMGCGSAAAVGGTGATVAGSVAAGGTTVGLASLGAKGVVTKVLAVVALAGGTTEAHVRTERAPADKAPPVKHHAGHRAAAAGAGAAAVRLHASAGRFAPSPVLRHGSAPKHHATATDTPPAPADTAPVTPATPVGPAPMQTPAATPAPVQQTAAPAAQTPAANAQQQQAPASTAAPATQSAPAADQAAPTSAPAPAAQATPAPTTPQPSPAPDTSAQTTPAPEAAPAETPTAAAPAVAPDAAP
jgi:RNA polymerase sigma factor (sigma-70 family)